MRAFFKFLAPAIAAGAALLGLPASAQTFQADLDPASYDAGTRVAVQGTGRVTGSLTGNVLSIDGKFSGLSSAATKARLGQAIVLGAPAGSFFADLTITPGPAGTIVGRVTLTPAQLASLAGQTLFIQVDAVKTTAAGSLWGWFMIPGKGTPQ